VRIEHGEYSPARIAAGRVLHGKGVGAAASRGPSSQLANYGLPDGHCDGTLAVGEQAATRMIWATGVGNEASNAAHAPTSHPVSAWSPYSTVWRVRSAASPPPPIVHLQLVTGRKYIRFHEKGTGYGHKSHKEHAAHKGLGVQVLSKPMRVRAGSMGSTGRKDSKDSEISGKDAGEGVTGTMHDSDCPMLTHAIPTTCHYHVYHTILPYPRPRPQIPPLSPSASLRLQWEQQAVRIHAGQVFSIEYQVRLRVRLESVWSTFGVRLELFHCHCLCRYDTS
jgi:hypothetical protein